MVSGFQMLDRLVPKHLRRDDPLQIGDLRVDAALNQRLLVAQGVAIDPRGDHEQHGHQHEDRQQRHRRVEAARCERLRDFFAQAADEAEADRTGTTKTLAVIACCGSLDDLTLFVPLLVGSDVGFFALLIGSMAAVGVIVAFCVRSPGVRSPGPFHHRPQVFLNFFKRVSDCLQAIPLVCITSAFCAFLVAKAATMH